MKLSDVVMEIQETLDCERKSYDEGACQDENIKGWIEALEYTQGLLNRVKPDPDPDPPEPTTYNSSAIENLEYIEKVVFQLINGNKDDIHRDDIYTSIAWLAEDLGYIYKNGGYMRKEDYLKIVKPDSEPKTIKVSDSWCVEDVRHFWGDDVKHMTDEEIYDKLDDIASVFDENAKQSGWDTIEHCFEIKEIK